MNRRTRTAFAVAMAALPMAGCVVPINGGGGTMHHVVLGFGIVSVNESTGQTVTATRVQSLGLAVTDRPALTLGLGYSSSTVVTAIPGVDAIVEVSQRPGGPLTVDTRRIDCYRPVEQRRTP